MSDQMSLMVFLVFCSNSIFRIFILIINNRRKNHNGMKIGGKDGVLIVIEGV